MEAQDDMPENIQADATKQARKGKTKGAKISDPEKRSLNLRVDEATYQKLTVHALMRKTTISQMVMDYARDQLREYSIHRNGRSGQGPE